MLVVGYLLAPGQESISAVIERQREMTTTTPTTTTTATTTATAQAMLKP